MSNDIKNIGASATARLSKDAERDNYMNGITICGTGSAVPENIMTNEDLTKLVDTNDEWISSRTGIKSRRIATTETTTGLAAAAARQAIQNSGIRSQDIGLLIVATFTPDNFTPSVACMVQRELGLNDVSMAAFDLNAACSGFIYSLVAAGGMLASMPEKYGLVIGAEVVSRTIDYTDRGTCILFGDGAGAAVIKHKGNARLFGYLDAKGDEEILCAKSADKTAYMPQKLSMNGRDVYQFAVEIVPRCIQNVLDQADCTLDDIRYVVCHQANSRIITTAAERMGASPGQFVQNIETYGNTSAASIPILLDELNRGGKLSRGDRIIMAGFGGGLTWGAVMLEW